MNQGIAADLDRQTQQRNMAYAQDNARIRQMQEQREREDLAGLGQMANVGRQDKYGGIQDVGQGLLSMGAIAANGALGQQPGGGTPRPMAQPLQLQQMGIVGGNTNISAMPYLYGTQAGAQPMGMTNALPYAPVYTGQ
jgi:hypothetical protein